MNREIKCKYLELQKSSNYKKISEEEFKNILEIVKVELSFLVRNNIPPLPKWYERWFLIFCHIFENNKQLSDLEIKGIYKTIYSDAEEEEKKGAVPKQIINNVTKISENIEKTLEEIIINLEKHQEKLEKHTENIESKSKEIKEKSILQYLEKILSELSEIRKENMQQKQQLSKYHKEIVKLREELSIARREAEQDFLTGLPNRRRFYRALEDFLQDYKTKNYIFSFIILDIDDFKKVNDTYGHLVGDEVLKDIASVLKFYLRANTIIGRLGGEEFGIILPGVDVEGAKAVAERLRRIIENRKVHIDEYIIDYTASFGVTQVKENDTVEDIIDRADKALYEAKKAGKNKVVVKI